MTASEAPLAGVRVDRRVMRLAALFVQPDGCYAGLQDVDAWPEARDARRYTGPLPVVAHPPCQLWGAMANVNYARWGGEHNKPGNDGGCFAAALESVRRFGGVLEHPAKTKAWAAHGLAQPAGIGWQRTIDGGWVCEVWQSAYGHRANKATWLYYHGTNPPFELRWARPVGTHQIGFQDQRGKAANKPTLGKREANATPLEFRDELLRLAMKAHNALAQADAACGVSPGATGSAEHYGGRTMATRKIEEIWPGLQPMAKKAQLIAETQGRPAYVALNPTGDVSADFPGVDCHRVHANGDVDCCVCAP